MTTSEWVLAIIQALSAVVVTVYVIITALNLREVRKQTELAVKAVLKNRFYFVSELPPDCERITHPGIYSLRRSWLKTVRQLFPKESKNLTDQYCVLELSNRGKTDIDEVNLELRIEVYKFPGTEFLIEPSEIKISVNLRADITPGAAKYFSVFSNRYFPVYRLTITRASYTDIRNEKYEGIFGDKITAEVKNFELSPEDTPF